MDNRWWRSRVMARPWLVWIGVILGGWALVQSGSALALEDPTKPKKGAGTGSVAAAAGGAEAETEEKGPMFLQMTRVSVEDRYAVIDGNVVQEGQKVGDMMVQAIEVGSVRGAVGDQILTLRLPSVEQVNVTWQSPGNLP